MTSTILENLPQIITSLAALITAVTGLIKVLRDKDSMSIDGCAAPLLLLAGDLSSLCSDIVLNPDATQGVTPSPLCCAAHRAGSRLAPLTRAAVANASFGLRARFGRLHPAPTPPGRKRPPRPSRQRPSGVGILCQCAIVLSVDCAAQRGAGRDGAVSP